MVEPKELCLFNASTRRPMRSTLFQLKKPFGLSFPVTSKKDRFDILRLLSVGYVRKAVYSDKYRDKQHC